jgi:hypothetical protein
MNNLILIAAFLAFGLWTLLCIGVGVRIGLGIGSNRPTTTPESPLPPLNLDALKAEWEQTKMRFVGGSDQIKPESYADDEPPPPEKDNKGVQLGA